MRVLHLPVIICNVISETVRGLNKIGVKADYLVLDSQGSEWLLTQNNIKYNLNASELVKNDPDMRRLRKTLYKIFLKSLDQYDIFHFHSGISLFSPWLDNFKDLEILKKAGKKIVVSYWGCDARRKKINSQFKYNTCDVCQIGCDDQTKLKQIEIFKKYADLITVYSGEYAEVLPEAILWNPIVNTEFWKPYKDDSQKDEVVKIFHPFGNSELRGDVKGSINIVQAAQKLQEEGYNIKFLSADKVKNVDLKPIYNQADIVIEQLRAGWLGATAREALSMGKPVITYLRADSLKHCQTIPPVVNASPDTIYKELKNLIENESLRKRIGNASQEYALKEFNPISQAKKMEVLYEKILEIKRKPTIDSSTISVEVRRAISFRVLLETPKELIDDTCIHKEAKHLVRAGFQVIAIGYALPSSNKSKPEYYEQNGYKNFRGCYERQPRWLKYIDFLKLFHLPKPKFFDLAKMSWFEKIISIPTRLIHNIYAILYYIRYYLLMTYQLYERGLYFKPDIVYAKDLSTLLAGYYIKKANGCWLIYDSSKNSIEPNRPVPQKLRKLFNFLKNIYSHKADVNIVQEKDIVKVCDTILKKNL